MPPVKPMLAKSVTKIPPGMQYEAKWDGFRAIVHRDGDELVIGSRTGKPLTRYFPELVAALLANLPARCVVDGEIVIAHEGRLDFDRLTERIHPAESRVRLLAEQTPASFVAFDLLALGDELCWTPRSRTGARRWPRRWPDAVRPCTSRPRPPTPRWRRSGSSGTRAPGSTGSSPSRSICPTGRTPG